MNITKVINQVKDIILDHANPTRNAFGKFKKVVEGKDRYYKEGYSDIYLDLGVKRFEFTFEMSWKTMKRVLDYEGIKTLSPRSTIIEAFAQEYISDEEVWIEMMDRRNLSSHIYSEWQVREILPRLNIYLQAFEALIEKIIGRFGNEEE